MSWKLTTVPADAMKMVEVYQDGTLNYVAKVTLANVPEKRIVQLDVTSAVLVRPSVFDHVPVRAAMPLNWPQETQSWLASTWCATSSHTRIASIGNEIRRDADDDVMAIIRGVEERAKQSFRSVEGRVKKLTAVEALDARGSCTSCANLVAAMLRASNVPARILAGYPSWSGPLQTHYLVEAYVPDYGWYPIESTRCHSPWPNMYQVNVAVIPTEYESQSLADRRSNAAGGVPYLSLTESPGNDGQFVRRGTLIRGRSCDHQCEQLRQYTADREEWDATMQWARSRWQKWVDSSPRSATGVLSYSVPAKEIQAKSLEELSRELAD